MPEIDPPASFDTFALAGRRILLIISGGIAAYKTLDLIRRLKERGATVRAVLTAAAQHFVTPLSVSALSGEKVFTDLWSLTDESEMGHIRLSREADLVVVAPASADLIARMAAGLADDLATTALLATDKPVLIAPTMNIMMWSHPATQANLATLKRRGILQIGPAAGDLACGETGSGRMSEPLEILAAIEDFFRPQAKKPLSGLRAFVTSGPTYEPIDPVRFIGNRSSGKQGHTIAGALADLGAATVLISGPSHEPVPEGVEIWRVETAREMLAACEKALPVDVAVFAAAVADWHVAGSADRKIKKTGREPPALRLVENPDILAAISQEPHRRPRLVIGFAAETENVVEYASEKRRRKGCDWILANDVSASTGVFGGDNNTIHMITGDGAETWPLLSKAEVAERLALRIADHLKPASNA